jgi:hypothetical protein
MGLEDDDWSIAAKPTKSPFDRTRLFQPFLKSSSSRFFGGWSIKESPGADQNGTKLRAVRDVFRPEAGGMGKQCSIGFQPVSIRTISDAFQVFAVFGFVNV